MTRYKIHTLSAKAVIGFAKAEEDERYSYRLSAAATRRCIAYGTGEQDDNALFYQIMCVLHGGRYPVLENARLVTDLEDVIFYMDFSVIFDRSSSQKYLDRQSKAESMFRPEGVSLNFGNGEHSYVAFERSGSMSRQAKLSFIRAALYDEVRRRIMLDMTVGDCQLSKLYAYNGLMLSGGTRIEEVNLTVPHRVIVVPNNEREQYAKCITVEGGAVRNGYRDYQRVEHETEDRFTVTEFDGEGLISKRLAKVVNRIYDNGYDHTSFQIRMPCVKGMLHQVDFQDFYKSAGVTYITDIWNVRHPVDEIDIILSKSMFKGYGWLTESGMSWEDYLAAFRKYDHALYVTNVSKPEPEKLTELNFQFLNTLNLTAEEFRPSDLPLGWMSSPANDERHWLTKATEQRYYDFCANEEFRLEYFTRRRSTLAKVLRKNPLFINGPKCVDELKTQAEHILGQYSRGRLLVAGDNRFLSGDLIRFMTLLIDTDLLEKRNSRQKIFFASAITNRFEENAFFAPGAVYDHGEVCTLLRNPHISRNEEAQLKVYDQKDNMRDYYLGHLTDVVMVDTETLTAQRLGGADFDGDMIKTISDPLINDCVNRNFFNGRLDKSHNLPLLLIPSEKPVMRNADDWHDRFITVRDTFSSRVGQICNAAFDRSVIAYDENSDAEMRRSYQEETETLAILVGLEIDSAKSGVKPNLDAYLTNQRGARSGFLKYKTLLDDKSERKWFEKRKSDELKEIIADTDWDSVTSNVEKLPYYAYNLKKYTPVIKPQLAADEELFKFATPGWKDRLDKPTLEAVSELLTDYEHCLSRIRACRAPTKNRSREQDVDRILYARGQEELYDSDTLYAAFSDIEPERIGEILSAVRDEEWHLMAMPERLQFLADNVSELEDWFSLLSDFRHSGFRVLGDILMDYNNIYDSEERKKLHRDSDSEAFTEMMNAYIQKPHSQSYREAVSEVCRKRLDKIVKPHFAVFYVVALGKRKYLWDLLEDHILENVKKYDKRD